MDEALEASDDALWCAFVDPPDEARPRAWWHWMDGNVDTAGIVRDLAWMRDVGLAGVQLFDGSLGGDVIVPEPVRAGTAAWDEAVALAFETARALGLEVAVASSAGWSAAGAPWVEPADAMKKIVWSEAVVEGGRDIELRLPALPDAAGPYQDIPRWGSDGSPRWSTPWRTLAIPRDATHDARIPVAARSSAGPIDAASLVDGSFGNPVRLPRDPDARSSAWVEVDLGEPAVVRSVVVGLPAASGFGAAPPPDARLEASDDGARWEEIARLAPSPVPVRSATFAPVSARRFRIVLEAEPAASALPPLPAGVRVPPVLRPASSFEVSQFALREASRGQRSEFGAGFAAAPLDDDLATPDEDPAGVVEPDAVLDLTDAVDEGVLRWRAPAGCWRILHFGASLTGATNGPALPDATGLEVDKLDRARVRAYLDRYLERFAPPGSGLHPDALLSDSIEAGSQNWTDRLSDELVARRGYDPLPWLPAITGLVVGSPSETDRFLHDLRATIAELLVDGHYAGLAETARERGMRWYSEALEDGRPQLGDDLAMRAAADVPMGAMWAYGEEGPRATCIADLRGAASVAHVRGRRWVGSEAFTAFGDPWASSPGSLKPAADRQLALGVTRMCIHASPHQPAAARAPGIPLAPFLGQVFTRHETWSAMARPWIDYLSRCCAVLSWGEPDVHVAVFAGEEAPITGLSQREDELGVPPGLGFDWVDAAALRTLVRAERGRILAPGASYDALLLGPRCRQLSIAVLDSIERLAAADVAVVGARPTGSPSLADDPAEVEARIERLWGTGLAKDEPVSDALARLGVAPWLRVEGGEVLRIGRRGGAMPGRVELIVNPESTPLRVSVHAVRGEPLELWDPVAVTRRPAAPGAGGAVAVDLAAHGSVFVVTGFLPAGHVAPEFVAAAALAASGARPGDGARRSAERLIGGAWRLSLDGGAEAAIAEPIPWTELGLGDAALEGAYRARFAVDATAADRPSTLALGTLHGVASVRVDGTERGIVWAPPFELDLGPLAAGEHELELRVAGPWRNRLIAEAREPSGAVPAALEQVFERDARPAPAGLAGPVLLRYW